MKYLISDTTVYRVATVEDVETLHEELLSDNSFELVSFGYKTKYIKQKGEIIDEYQLVTAKKVFQEEKDPSSAIDVKYGVEF